MNPRMLTVLRESRGLTQSQLAKKTGIPQPTISKVENGTSELDDARLATIADELGYPRHTFSWPDEIFGFGSAPFHHRKQQSLGQTALRRIHADINLIRMRIKRLLAGIDIEPHYRMPSVDVDELGSPSEVARAVRALWAMPMGPVMNLMRTLENAGAIVVRYDFGSPRISAVSISVPDSPPLFILNSGMPADRERFTLAHELGHLVMHDAMRQAGEAEREADEFASEFLMPASEIRPQLSQLDLAKAAQLKRAWRTAMSAIVRRARDLGRIDEPRYRSLNVQISQRGWRHREPVDLEHEEPTVLSQVIELHHDTHGYSVSDLDRKSVV